MDPTVSDADILAMALAELTVAHRRLVAEYNALKSKSGANVTVLPDNMDTTEPK
jgi:hypothetical protein